MKKILTLLIAVGAVVFAQAQTSKEETRRVILGDGGNGRNYPSGGRDVILGGGQDNRNSYPSGDRQYQIDQVNREYDAKVQSIRNNSYLSYEEKERSIRQLEKDRQRKIQRINSGNNGSYRNDDDRNNNGKHKGWNKKKKNKNWKKGKKNRDDD